jgi:hypothetical protein
MSALDDDERQRMLDGWRGSSIFAQFGTWLAGST